MSRRWQAESAASRPTNSVSGALAWLKGLQHSAQNMVAGRSDDALEDAEYLKVRDGSGRGFQGMCWLEDVVGKGGHMLGLSTAGPPTLRGIVAADTVTAAKPTH